MLSSRPIPLGSFGSVLGVVGLGLAWREAAAVQGVPALIGECIIGSGAVLFVVLLVAWLSRIKRHPQEIRDETDNPLISCFYATITISLSLLAASAVHYSKDVAFGLWIVAAIGSAGLFIYLLGHWIEHKVQPHEFTPALLLPIVGNAATTYATVPLGLIAYGWASFSIALICWLAFVPLTLYRLMAVEPHLSRKLAPHFAVYVSAPAVLATAWYMLNGHGTDTLFIILAYSALFFAVMTVRLWKLAWGEPYNVVMWGWTFPAAALAGAFERAATGGDAGFFIPFATLTLVIATLVVLACIGATLGGWVRRFIARPLEPASS